MRTHTTIPRAVHVLYTGSCKLKEAVSKPGRAQHRTIAQVTKDKPITPTCFIWGFGTNRRRQIQKGELELELGRGVGKVNPDPPEASSGSIKHIQHTRKYSLVPRRRKITAKAYPQFPQLHTVLEAAVNFSTTATISHATRNISASSPSLL